MMAARQGTLGEAGLIGRMTAYIAPRAPQTDGERAAFDAAVAMQGEFEADPAVQRRIQTRGMEEFSVNGFSAQLKDEPELFPGGLCPDARAVLFNAGLLYRGAGLC
jgi:hypothetical protein